VVNIPKSISEALMNNVITTQHLSKNYGSFEALKDVNLSIRSGRIIGLIGLNGAGKTTLLKALLGLTRYRGEVSVLGLNPRSQRTQLMNKMCFIADVAILPRWLKVINAVEFVEGVHPNFNRNKAMGFLSKTNIQLNTKIKTLSKGMIVQLHLALIMAIDADILILDEPTLGLDILYRKQFYRNLLNDYFNEERTIIVTTHQVEEIEYILTDLLMIDRGRVILDCSMQEIAKQFVQVAATPDCFDALKQLKPLSYQKQINKTQFLFENMDHSKLSEFGELSTPSISDIFVAKVSGEST